jgi:hypothetical protein
MAPKPLTRSEVADLTRSLQALLDAIHNDELTASTATTYRLEGAVKALEAVLGHEARPAHTQSHRRQRG